MDTTNEVEKNINTEENQKENTEHSPEQKAHENAQEKAPEEDKSKWNMESNGEDKNLLLAICAYIGPLIVISFLSENQPQFVKFHIKQGAVLFFIEIVAWIIGSFLWFMFPIIGLINLIAFVLSVIGILNVVKKKEKPLPIVGHFSKYFNF